MRRRLLLLLIWFGLCASASGSEPRPVPGLVLDPRTTVLTQPLNEYGFPAYGKSLNDAGLKIPPGLNFWAQYFETIGPGAVEKEVLNAVRMTPGFQAAGSTPFRSWREFSGESTDDELKELQDRPWRSEQHPRVAKWLEENETALQLAAQAALRPMAHPPRISTDTELLRFFDTRYLDHTRNVARAFCVRSMLNVANGYSAYGWRDLMCCRRIAAHLRSFPGALEDLVAISIEGLAQTASVETIIDPAVQDGALVARWKEASKFLSPQIAPQLLLRYDRMSTAEFQLAMRADIVDSFDLLEEDRPKTDTWLGKQVFRFYEGWFRGWILKGDVNDDLRYFADFFDAIEAAMAIPEFARRRDKLAEIEAQYLTYTVTEDTASERAMRISGQLREGRPFFLSVMASPWSLTNLAMTRAAAKRLLIHAAFVAELHYRRTGRDVRDGSELASVAPQIARSAGVTHRPCRDPFSTREFRVRRTSEGLLIYSIGPNLADDDGQRNDEEKTDDIAILLRRSDSRH